MPFLIALIGLALPRLAIILLALASDWFSRAFDHWVIPLIGFFFLPYTLLWYSVVVNWFDGAWGIWQVVILAIALAMDLGATASTPSRRHHKPYA